MQFSERPVSEPTADWMRRKNGGGRLVADPK